MRGRPKASLVLTEAERGELLALAVRRKTAQAVALRARIVLACADGVDNNTVAERLKVTKPTVSKWRSRFVQYRREDCWTRRAPAHRARSTTNVSKR